MNNSNCWKEKLFCLIWTWFRLSLKLNYIKHLNNCYQLVTWEWYSKFPYAWRIISTSKTKLSEKSSLMVKPLTFHSQLTKVKLKNGKLHFKLLIWFQVILKLSSTTVLYHFEVMKEKLLYLFVYPIKLFSHCNQVLLSAFVFQVESASY